MSNEIYFFKMERTWRETLKNEFSEEYFKNLQNFLTKEKKEHHVFPPENQVFNAFNSTPFDEVKVVILGQDPYHGLGQANGLSFSVNPGIKFPPSLRNIFKELKTDLDIAPPLWGDLTPWAMQGVLLLNATLTVRKATPGSHQNKGWEQFTSAAINALQSKENIVYILWGQFAQQKSAQINAGNNLILKSAHPSPFSAHRGFFGSKPFSTTNKYLKKHNIEPINWELP